MMHSVMPEHSVIVDSHSYATFVAWCAIVILHLEGVLSLKFFEIVFKLNLCSVAKTEHVFE